MEVQGKTIDECFNALAGLYPEIREKLFDTEGRLYGYLHVFINGLNAYPHELTKPVKNGDEIHINVVAMGG